MFNGTTAKRSDKMAAVGGDDENIWTDILEEVQTTSGNRLPKNKSVIFLGDNESGKTSLVARLQDFTEPAKGESLEYHFLPVRDEREDSTNLNVWIVGGDGRETQFLDYCFKADSLADSIAVICVPINEPWALLDSLQRWVTVLRDHIDKLDVPPDQIKEYQQVVLRNWIDYTAPDEVRSIASSMSLSSMSKSAVSGAAGSADPTTEPTANNMQSSVQNGLSSSNNGSQLGESILTDNLGVQLVVCVTKVDQMRQLETDHQYNDEHFDLIQYHVRQACMRHGASLFYCSGATGVNCELLKRYLMHKSYGFNFNTPGQAIERDSVFIPAGWDNERRCAMLLENIINLNTELPYTSLIRRTNFTKPTVRDEAEVTVPSEQDFLQKQLLLLQKELPAETMPAVSATYTSDSSPRVGLTGVVSSPNLGRRGSRPSSTASLSGAAASENTVLQEFFNSLLTKTTPGNSPAGRQSMSPGPKQGTPTKS